MDALILTVTLIGALCAVDLVCTLDAIRRGRTDPPTRKDSRRPAPGVGDPVAPFATSTVDGIGVNQDMFDDETLVAFFSTTSRPCEETLPKFVEFAREMPGGRARTLAVIVGESGAERFTEELVPVARVVVERNSRGPLCRAFRVTAFPVVSLVGPNDGGSPIVTYERVPLELPARAPA
ncbi:hypothetical protein F0L68_23625 [Solihabitans fulvus]|uniref:Thioredoxin domain-containing protein n=1 Tax=Solihabitans fulvus TaxID=1892852 RepID=A0A5B2X6I6_9PSEU|nr:hypothetical protein [Solihabitans fulvus]KAA2258815.1 hypothetical protein F0L68_23625 [Solihabitans fulvus]